MYIVDTLVALRWVGSTQDQHWLKTCLTETRSAPSLIAITYSWLLNSSILT